MVQQRRGASRKVLGNHNRAWIWGRHLVLATLCAGRWKPLEILLADNLATVERDQATQACGKLNVPYRVVTRSELESTCRARDHQGFAARMPTFPYAELEQLTPPAGPSAIAIVDRIQDPYNLGAIIRSAEIFAWSGLVLGTDHQAEVTSQVARSSAGAVNTLPLARVEELTGAIAHFKTQGYRVVAASEKAPGHIDSFKWPGRTVLILGNEGAGPSPSLLSLCDDLVAIPQYGTTPSLNVGATAAILFHDWKRTIMRSTT